MPNGEISSKEIRRQLTNRYPYLLPRRLTDNKVPSDYDYEYVLGEGSLPSGWFPLFLQCCEDILGPLKDDGDEHRFRFLQIKEKYGSMRLYNNGASGKVLGILDKYEFLSQQVCTVCGKPATVMTSGYICPYCSEHVRGTMANVDDSELIELQTSYVKKIWSPDGITDYEVDCSDEWNRYLKRIGYVNET